MDLKGDALAKKFNFLLENFWKLTSWGWMRDVKLMGCLRLMD